MGRQAVVNFSPEGVKFICSFEGFSPLVYRDSGGKLTLGYGTRITEEQASKFKRPITEEQGQQMLSQYLVSLGREMGQYPLNGLLQHQLDALGSFCYNCGVDTLVRSSFWPAIRSREANLNAWLLYDKDAKGQRQQGLVDRRARELKLFVYAIY